MNNFDFISCQMCGRTCKVNRIDNFSSFCQVDQNIFISSIFNHKGEEPPISGNTGICNVFFAHCNLQCVYCQNFQISNNKSDLQKFKISLEQAVEKIISILNTGAKSVGFVSPSHFVLQTIDIIELLHKKGYYPTIVYNTNAYDNVESLKILEKYVDVYLPDFKYSNDKIAVKYSQAPNYRQIATSAIKEMIRQKGDFLYVNSKGYAESGVIIRHLVLPNNTENSIGVLEIIANELSKNVHLSLMSQYYPTYKSFYYPELSRHINQQEYYTVVEKLNELGLKNGWIQEFESKDYYRPNFENSQPFED